MTFDPSWASAIGSIESSGRYGLLGPVTKSGDRAYGKYQVMGSNVGPWTKEVLGQSMTPDQFLANPQAQDAVFAAKFGQAADKYGNPQDAASVWFTGKPLAQGANKSDMLGTTGAAYVAKFNKALGLPQAVAQGSMPPQQQASLPPASQPAPTAPPSNANLPLGMFQQQPAPYSLPQQAMLPQMQQQLQQQSLSPMQRRPLDLSGLAALLQNAPQIQNLISPRTA